MVVVGSGGGGGGGEAVAISHFGEGYLGQLRVNARKKELRRSDLRGVPVLLSVWGRY